MEPKPAIKTTEAWIASAAAVTIGAAVAGPLTMPQAVGCIGLALLGVGYAWARASTKKGGGAS